jgi:hypothetical protein
MGGQHGSVKQLALAGARILLSSNIPAMPARLHAYLSAAPLALAGLAYALLQFYLRPARGPLLKRLALAATFLVWAVDQLLPPGRLATWLGDAVIAAYVLDLFWLSQEQASSHFLAGSRKRSTESTVHSR